ncbi:MAG TPA: hypothetical protein VGN20_22275 [Mucilaginibacter sp.]|jgi:hypothetical protein
MCEIIFTPTFSGGLGTVDILINGNTTLSFNSNTPQSIVLPSGNHDFVISGAASPGPGGGLQIDIGGDAITDTPINYGAGVILPDPHNMIVDC